MGAHPGRLARQGVLLAAAAKTGLALLDARGGSVLAALDSAGLVNHGAALSADGRLFAAATFTADVKARAPGRPPPASPTPASGAAGRGAAPCRPCSSCCRASGWAAAPLSGCPPGRPLQGGGSLVSTHRLLMCGTRGNQSLRRVRKHWRLPRLPFPHALQTGCRVDDPTCWCMHYVDMLPAVAAVGGRGWV
jgi:hypothetical protein